MAAEANYFNVSIDNSINEEFGYLLAKSPYTSEEEIGELFSHLVCIDEVQKEKNARDLKLTNKIIKLKFCYNDKDGARVENLQIPLGQGHFSKGINHLREVGKIDWENNLKENDISEKLSKQYDKYLTKPPALDVLRKGSLATLQQCAKILDTIPSPELADFIEAFMGDNKNKNIKFFDDEDKKQKSNEQKNENNAEKEKTREEKIEELKAKARKAAEKKSNTRQRARERTNHKDLGIYA